MKLKLIGLLQSSIKYHVSDIHFTLMDDTMRIEMRIGGRMIPINDPNFDMAFYRYLMYRSNLDLSLSSMPQTGHFEEIIEGRKVNVRFAVLNSNDVSSGVLRILNEHDEVTIDNLCDEEDITEKFKAIANEDNGLIVFSGPTSSGKTTSVYTILNSIRNKKIYSIEDPIEIYNENIMQIQVNEKAGLSYKEGIKQLMRHDPDIIMIGEIRDEEAAKMAVRAALTGHLVLTTLHASSCTGAIERLLELGVVRLQLLDVLKTLFNQRLIDKEDHKTGIYEFMDQSEIAYYFKNGEVIDGHLTIEDKLKQGT